MSAASQKNTPRTRGKSLTAAAEMPDQPIANPTQKGGPKKDDIATILATIQKRLDKLDVLDVMDKRMEQLEQKIDALTKLENRVEKLAASTDEFMQQTVARLEETTGRMDANDRQHESDAREMMIMSHNLGKTESDNKQLRQMVNDMESKSREINLKIEGKSEDETENLRDYVMDMAAHLTPNGLDPAAVAMIRRLGRRPTTQPRLNQRTQPRPILITFRSVQDRNLLYYARTKLKDSDRYRMIYLNDDATVMTKRAREDFRSVAALVRADGKEVRIHDDGIVVEGRKYKHAEADLLPANYSMQKAKTVEIDGGLYFQSSNSFLSNFYPAPIIDDKRYYPTAEHKLQAEKCVMANDAAQLKRVMTAKTPLDAKRMGDQIQESQEWRNAREEVLKKIIDLKFDQNRDLALQLIGTQPLTLHEATPNAFYGIGASLHSRELRNRQHTGLNKLGKALEAKRANLIAATTSQD